MGDKKKRRKKSKRPSFILGFDETNNGFNLDSEDYKPHKDSNLIVTGYLTNSKGAQYGSRKYESKRKIFNNNRDIERALTRGRYYIGQHPNFFYTVVSRRMIKHTPLPLLRANAIALLTFKFFSSYDINPQQTQIVLDQMDGKDHTDFVKQGLGIWLEDTKIKTQYRVGYKADQKVPAVRTADRIGYYLAAIKFLGNLRKWPYRSRKISLSHLEDLAAEMRESFS